MKTLISLLLFVLIAATAPALAQSEKAPDTYPGPVSYSDEEYDLLFEYPCGNATGEAGIETDGTYIYTSLWNGDRFCKYGTDGTYLEAFSIPGVAAVRDMAFDGTYFYGAAANTLVFEMDFNTQTLINTITAPTAIRGIAYDEYEDGFWGNNWSTPIKLFNRSGVTLNTIYTAGDESYYGFAYDPGETSLWGYSQKTGTSQNMLYKIDVINGIIVDEFDVLTVLTLPTPGDIAGGLFMCFNLLYPFQEALGGLVQNICLWCLDMGGGAWSNDVGVQLFVSPVSGLALGEEIVTVRVKNYSPYTLNNIPVTYTLDGGMPVAGILPGPIAPEEAANYTFPGTVNLSTPGRTYVFNACTAMEGDANPDNNCKTTIVIHFMPGYCDASTSYEDEYISNIHCGEIDNSSFWQDGVADYTALQTFSYSGASENITVTNGSPIAGNKAAVWVDWNNDSIFEAGTNEEFIMYNVGGASVTFTGTVIVPLGQPDGNFRMRIRLTYVTDPNPCGNRDYGEIEDYTINIYNPPQNDVGVYAFVSPTGGPYLGDEEIVTIRVKNFSTSSQVISNIPVYYNLDGGTPVTGVVPGPIAPGQTEDFTFPGTVNLSNPGQSYVFYGCTTLEGDENPANDCKTMNLLYMPTEYCDASTTNQQEYVQHVIIGSINHQSGWQDSIADYTNYQTAMTELWPEEITVEVLNSRPGDSVFVWIDWNQDFIFGTGSNEEYVLTNEYGTRQSFTGTITVPENTPTGIHRMRIRLTYNSTPEPCGVTAFGEIEDYTIVVITPLSNDVGVEAILSPQSGTNLTDNVVTIRIKNFGAVTQNNIPVFYTVDGGTPVNGIVKGPVEIGAAFDYTFPGFVDMGSTFQTFTFVACTSIDGDENPDNDCKTVDVTNIVNSYYDCSTVYEDEYIANVLFGDINNSSGWQGGVADYTDQFTMIRPGESETITITNGNAWANDIVYAWVDWNQDYCFDQNPGLEQYILTNISGLGETFVGDVTVPEGQACGAYRLRIRMSYSIIPSPGGTMNYGEVEDYTVVVRNPDLPEIGVNPVVLSQTLNSGQTTTQSQTVSNIGGTSLNFDITSDTLNNTNREVNLEKTDTKFIRENQFLFAPFIPGCSPVYCIALTTTEDEYISNVLLGDINNSSGWQYWPADFTNLFTTIEAGSSETITVTNGLPYTNDLVTAWLDWNKDFEFDAAGEQYILTNQYGTGETFTGEISVPENQPTGDYRLRIRMCYYTEPVPCGGSTWGEVEEYSVHVVNNQTVPWLTVEPMSGVVNPNDSTLLEVTFDATGLQNGTYQGSIVINSNDPGTPFTTIPVTLFVGQCPLPPPLNPEGFEILPNVAYLSWQAPEVPGNLMGYNVYRNNGKINPEIITSQFYEDSLANPSQYFYFITAVYPECEASSDTILLVITNLPEKENDGVRIFPNPAGDFILVQSKQKIMQIEMSDSRGRICFYKETDENQIFIKTGELGGGIYYLRLKTATKPLVRKILIQR